MTSMNLYDYQLRCQALSEQLANQPIIVNSWQGQEAVSRLYKYEITVALSSSTVDLGALLDQSARFSMSVPSSSLLGQPWFCHGIITEATASGYDGQYYFYKLVLEPRLVRLDYMFWSDIYLSQSLKDLIVDLLHKVGLNQPADGENGSGDYAINVSSADLEATKTDFTCQFQESCLAFLLRKLEHHGVYFWFEQGAECETVVFANHFSQQPQTAIQAIYYPHGTLDIDKTNLAITSLEQSIRLTNQSVSLRSLHNGTNTLIDLQAQTAVPYGLNGVGQMQSLDHYFHKLGPAASDTAQNDYIVNPGLEAKQLAQLRAELQAAQALKVQGVAETPGLWVGHYLELSTFNILGAKQSYYINALHHSGSQGLKTAPNPAKPSYQAQFQALPRYHNHSEVQFRPALQTPIPRITRLMSGFIDQQNEQAQRFAQPDDFGRYQVRLPFVRQRYEGYKNSAWLRMSTPFAGGAATDGGTQAGMHLPLREGTEVLIAFLNGDPDQPLIVGCLFNNEAPSVVDSASHKFHTLISPSGAGLTIVDNEDEHNGVHLYAQTDGASLNLGDLGAETKGFNLSAQSYGQIKSYGDLLIEVPGKYKLYTGDQPPEVDPEDWKTEAVTGTKTATAAAYSISATANAYEADFSASALVTSVSVANAINISLGTSAELNAAATTSATAGLVAAAELAKGIKVAYDDTKAVDITKRTQVINTEETVIKSRDVVVAEDRRQAVNINEKATHFDLMALQEFLLTALKIRFEVLGGFSWLFMEPEGIELHTKGRLSCEGTQLDLTARAQLTVTVGSTSVVLTPAGANVKTSGALDLKALTNVSLSGALVRLA